MKTTEQQVKDFLPGVYRHWKGYLYRALFLAQDSTNRESNARGFFSSEEPVVVYISLSEPYQGNVCVRELWQWNEVLISGIDGRVGVPRFDWVGP